ncbi:MAG: hypothetical protein ABIH34_04205 [Nanoarchaeota archaeon]
MVYRGALWSEHFSTPAFSALDPTFFQGEHLIEGFLDEERDHRVLQHHQ